MIITLVDNKKQKAKDSLDVKSLTKENIQEEKHITMIKFSFICRNNLFDATKEEKRFMTEYILGKHKKILRRYKELLSEFDKKFRLLY